MRERQKLDTSIAAVRALDNELADALGLLEMAEAENDAAVITEAENVRAAEEETEYRTEAEAAVEDIPPADEAEVETLEDRPDEALEYDAQSAEQPLLEEIETGSAASDDQADEEDGA